MNGVAKQFWSEVLDIRSPAPDEDRGGRKSARKGRKPQRKALTQQARRTSRPAA